MLSSQTAVDLYAGGRNDDKIHGNDSDQLLHAKQFTPQDSRGCEQGKCPDEGEHCTNSPGRHNLLILKVEEQSDVSVQADRW